MSDSQVAWTNWLGNHTSRPERYVVPSSHDEVVEALVAARDDGLIARVAGGGHSFTPLVDTEGLLLDLRNLSGVTALDQNRGVATVRGGTTISTLGQELFDLGCALRNVGDIDAQSIAGAIATGTHGSGLAYSSIADGVRRLRVATSDGRVIDVGADDPDALHAARVSLGLFGVVLEVDIDVVDAYWLQQRSWVASFEETMDEWRELAACHRHLSFYWMPTAASPALFEIDTWGLTAGADDCVIRTFDEVPRESATPTQHAPGRRRGPAHEVYPSTYDVCTETELFVPIEAATEAIRSVAARFRADPTLCDYPVFVRTIRADEAWVSPAHGRDSVAISVCGDHHGDYWRAVRALDEILDRYESRPHWGKLHVFDAERLASRHPHLGDFLRQRSTFDPSCLFVSPYLNDLLQIR